MPWFNQTGEAYRYIHPPETQGAAAMQPADTVTREPCRDCKGTKKCWRCKGNGRVEMLEHCAECGGSGECQNCDTLARAARNPQPVPVVTPVTREQLTTALERLGCRVDPHWRYWEVIRPDGILRTYGTLEAALRELAPLEAIVKGVMSNE